MEDLRIYDFEFNLLHIEPRRISDNWTIQYNDIGTYEGHFSLESEVVNIVLQNEFLVVVQGKKQAIITGSQAGESEFIVYGKTVNLLLSRRVTLPFNTYDMEIEKKAEDLARWAVSQAFIEGEEIDRVSNFVLGEASGISGDTEDEIWRTTAHQTSDIVKDILSRVDAGHRVIFDFVNKKWVFETYKGKTLQITIAESERNAYGTSYTVNYLNEADAGYYEHAIEKEPSEEETEEDTTEDATTETVRETEWLRLEKEDARTGIYRTVSLLSGSNESEAKSSLAEKVATREFKAAVKHLAFGEDYNLGDVLRVRIEKGPFAETVKKRVTGINIWYEANNIGEEPILE